MTRLIELSLALIVCAVIIGTAIAREEGASAPATQPTAARITVYVAVVTPGPSWREAEAAGKRLDMSRHLAYVTELRKRGKLMLGGPFSDGKGGLLVYRAGSMEEAVQLFEADPARIEKVFEAEIHPWSLNAADVR